MRGALTESRESAWQSSFEARYAATAILAGVIAQILVFPPGALASVPWGLRYGSVAIGLIAFIATKRSILIGVVAGEAMLIAGQWALA